MPRVGFISFRLGGSDGVAIEAKKWMDAFRAMGWDVTTIASEGDVDVVVPGLGIGESGPQHSDVVNALQGCDLVVAENILSLPLNLGAVDVLSEVLRGRPAILHHHDLASQRDHLRHFGPPPTDAAWEHVTINELSRKELASVGIRATTIPNHFDMDPPLGQREDVRRFLAIDDAPLVLFPSRVIPRKNVRGALELAQRWEAVLWILGPAEDGYDDTLQHLLSEYAITTRHGLPRNFSIHDAYSACDLVVVPSTWEGFGNPVIESVTHLRPLAAYPYPALEEIRQTGLHFFHLDDDSLGHVMSTPPQDLLARNLEIAREHYSLQELPHALQEVVSRFGGRISA